VIPKGKRGLEKPSVNALARELRKDKTTWVEQIRIYRQY
jgi:hypothetical protein